MKERRPGYDWTRLFRLSQVSEGGAREERRTVLVDQAVPVVVHINPLGVNGRPV
jgi:hypothetical protein